MTLIRKYYDESFAYWKILEVNWSKLDEIWKDKVKDRFKKEFWTEWENIITDFLKSLNDLSEEIEIALSKTNF